VDLAHSHRLPCTQIAPVRRLDIGDVRRLANEGLAAREQGHVLGADQHDGHLDPLTADEPPHGQLHVSAELGKGLIDGVEGVVADLGAPGRRRWSGR